MAVATARPLIRQPLPSCPAGPEVPARRSKLWLCAYFPELALLAAGLDTHQPTALQQPNKGRPGLYAVSASARQAGVESGMTPAAALALCPDLLIQPRDVRLEQIALSRLAEAALEFSPWVSQDYADALLLEVGTCLTLFGGAERLRERVRQALQNHGHRPAIALAPSPAAAELLARLGIETLVRQPTELRSLLGPVPLAALNLSDRRLKRLSRTGVQTLADLWRLPRDGLVRRYGVGLLRLLDALAGHDNRPLSRCHRPLRFAGRRELPAESEKLEHFFPAVEQLAEELTNFLRLRDAAASAVTLALHHHRRSATRIELSFRRDHRDVDHCCRLLREKLERTELPAPVSAVELMSQAIMPFQPPTVSLFDDDQDREHDWQTALEQLQSRLGPQALQYPGTVTDHRPERSGFLACSAVTIEAALPPRPLWLLSEPEALDPADLQCLPDTERIESGWWDGTPVRRDYRMAYDRLGRKLWVFRDLNADGNWYCHGLFG